jgi:hypothetical protein
MDVMYAITMSTRVLLHMQQQQLARDPLPALHRSTRVHDDWHSESGGEDSPSREARAYCSASATATAASVPSPTGATSARRATAASHDLTKVLHPVVRDKVRRYGMKQWPQYKQDEELRSLRRKLADLRWSLMPEEGKARTVIFYRRRRQRQQQGRLVKCFAAAVVLVALQGFVLLSLVLMGCFSLKVTLFLGLGYLALVFLLDEAGKEYGL